MGLALFAEISPPCEFPRKICFRLNERSASPPKRDVTIDYPRSRLGALEIFHVNARRKGSPSYNACALDPALPVGPENSHVKAK